MASDKIIAKKGDVISEIKTSVENSNSVVFFDYRGLTVEEISALRSELRESGSQMKIYKNTLTKRAMDELKLNLDEALEGPSAMAYGEDVVSPIKIVSDFAKKYKLLTIKAGIVEGKVTDMDTLNQLASLPSREGLLTMLAGGMIGLVKDLSISLDLLAQQKEAE